MSLKRSEICENAKLEFKIFVEEISNNLLIVVQFKSRNAIFKLVCSINIENYIFDFGQIDTQELLRRFVAFRRRAECRISSAGFAYLEAWNAPENAE